jgi:hypothetical protein
MSRHKDTETSGNHRRSFTRIFFDAETVATQDGQYWLVQLVDISLRGILIKVLPDQTLDPSKDVDISIHLGGDVQICMTTRVVNQQNAQVGLVCDHIDVDSMTHLRRLVELNVGDTSLLERELHALTELH